MKTIERTICWIVKDGVEVVTEVTDTGIFTVIHGGDLDGHEVVGAVGADADSQHYRAWMMARMTSWQAPPVAHRRQRYVAPAVSPLALFDDRASA